VLGDQLSATECAVLLMPVPLTETLGAVFVALLATVTVPLKAPVDFGAKMIFSVARWPAARVAPVRPPATV